MPNRILKESICTSDSVDGLSWFEEVFFYRLIVNCDDYGRMDARPSVLKARLFPLKERITSKDCSVALQKLLDAGVARTYVCEGKPYLYFVNWESHQSIRAKKSKYPDPSICEHMNASEIICNQMNANVPVIQSNPNPNQNPKAKTFADANDTAFDQFWNAYPRHVGRDKAKLAFRKAIDALGEIADRPLDILLNAIEKQKASTQWQDDGGKYIPHPTTWLNQKRWEDELPSASPAPAKQTIYGSGEVGEAEMEAIRRVMAEPTVDMPFQPWEGDV